MRLSRDESGMNRLASVEMGLTDEEIYSVHRQGLVRYATALVGPSHAEDVVSAVVLRTISKRKLSSLDNAEAYLFRAVLNESRSRLRRTRTVEFPEEMGQASDPDIDTTILDAVMGLPPQQRAATYLVYWADRSVAEAAALIGVGPGTVKRYLHDARKSLRKSLSLEEWS